MNRGEIWWFEHPRRGRRPVLILTRQEAIPVLTRIVVAPATTRIRGIDSELPLDREDGMPQPCVINFDNLFYVSKALLTDRITALSVPRLREMCQALRIATGC